MTFKDVMVKITDIEMIINVQVYHLCELSKSFHKTFILFFFDEMGLKIIFMIKF